VLCHVEKFTIPVNYVFRFTRREVKEMLEMAYTSNVRRRASLVCRVFKPDGQSPGQQAGLSVDDDGLATTCCLVSVWR